MKPWEDQDLLEMIVFAQQNPGVSLNPLRDRIQEMQYTVSDLMWHHGIEKPLIQIGFDCILWISMRLNIGFDTFSFDDSEIAIPFHDPQ